VTIDIEQRAYQILREGYGPQAQFRAGQLEAIKYVLEGKNSLVVQKTGWGKSLVYFIATRILREQGAGPTLIVSPLLSLMGNQIDSAHDLGVVAATINSDNKEDWEQIYSNINRYDAFIVSPERLGADRFMNMIASIPGIRLLVVDEAHCISDWGHDFRPDYQRVSAIIAGLPENVTILGTTATANDRVIQDVRQQLGNDLQVVRGDLMRSNLAIQVNPTQTREERLAWLSQVLVGNEFLSKGQGIIYCLTRNDCDALADYLGRAGISIEAYYAGMDREKGAPDPAIAVLERFMVGKTRVLAATTKLGMGYDKSDIRFVIHFQMPENLISYYQQIGRAGRDGKLSYAVLLHGQEETEILDYFIASSMTDPEYLEAIVNMSQYGVGRTELLEALNIKRGKLDEALKYLMVHDYVYQDRESGRMVFRANPTKRFDAEREADRQRQLRDSRNAERTAMLDFATTNRCFMEYVAAELDAPDLKTDCGICANCQGHQLVPVRIDPHLLDGTSRYLRTRHAFIEPRKLWGTGGKIPENLRAQQGWCLYADYYSEMGQRVKEEKYSYGRFSPELVGAAARSLRNAVPREGIECVVAVPSLRRPDLVPDLARGLAQELGISYCEVVRKTAPGQEQKALLNSVQQQRNIEQSIKVVNAELIRGKNILLVDDMVDSGWTFTVIASKLIQEGAAKVYPFALVKTGRGQ
jgi:ATP-dependent DNA helicase RecQ